MQKQDIPMYLRPTIIQELYDIALAINNRQEMHLEDTGYVNSRLLGMYNALLSIMSIFSLTQQPMENLFERSKRVADATLEDDLNAMIKELGCWYDVQPRYISGSKANYETIFEGIIAVAIKSVLEKGSTLKQLEQNMLTQTDFFSLHLGRAYSDYEYFTRIAIEATVEHTNKQLAAMMK